MKTTGYIPLPGLALALIAVALLIPPALADMVVVRSSGSSLKPGQTVAAGVSVTLPAGESATLLDQDGKTVTLTGPFSGAAEAAGAAHGDPQVVTALGGDGPVPPAGHRRGRHQFPRNGPRGCPSRSLCH
jgi:hypothetical protein